MGQKLEKTVCANAKALLKHHFPDMGMLAMGEASGIGKGTVERIMKNRANLTLGVIETLAKNCKAESWMLLVPNLKPDALPLLAEVVERERATLHRLRDILSSSTESRNPPALALSPENGKPHQVEVAIPEEPANDSAQIPIHTKPRRPKKR